MGNVSGHNSQYQSIFNSFHNYLSELGRTRLDPTSRALVYSQVQVQASSLAFMDTIWLLLVAARCILPLALFVKSSGRSSRPAMHAA